MNFMEMIRGLKDTDIAKSPNFVTIRTLYTKLLKLGFSEVEAVHVVSHIEVEVNENFVANYMEETTDIFAELALKIKKECNSISLLLFFKYIEANKLTLKFSM